MMDGDVTARLTESLMKYADLSAVDRSKHRIGSDGGLEEIGAFGPEAQADNRSELFKQATNLIFSNLPDMYSGALDPNLGTKIDPEKFDKLSRGIAAVFAKEVFRRTYDEPVSVGQRLLSTAVWGKLCDAVSSHNKLVAEERLHLPAPRDYSGTDTYYQIEGLFRVHIAAGGDGSLTVNFFDQSNSSFETFRVQPGKLEEGLKEITEQLQKRLAAKTEKFR